MAKSIYKRALAILPLTMLWVACENIWVPDPIDPRLPKYTEKGYQSAGAFINGSLWKSEVKGGFLKSYSHTPEIECFPEQDSLVITFSGDEIASGRSNVKIRFQLHVSQEISEAKDMVKINGTKFTIDGTVNKATISKYPDYICTASGEGQLYLKYIGKANGRSIMAGTFGFTLNDPSCGSLSVTYGRFDYIL